ncbi:hypothetical protein QUW41_06550 [Slackia piriformis]|nr:hypothetical protein [Slackia piriformis]
MSTASESILAAAHEAAADKDKLEKLFENLEGSSRRTRQLSASVLAVIARENPELVADRANAFVDALNRPEAQTRWECLDALTELVAVDSRACDKAIPGAETALFDEESGPARLAAMRFLCRLGSTTENRSEKVWPLIDEAIQCYHGDFEFQDMLVAVTGFSEGKLADAVKEALAGRMAFDASNGKGVLKRRAAQILENVK